MLLRAILAMLLIAPAYAQVVVADPPESHNFGRIPLLQTYATQYFSLTNSGTTAATIGQVAISGSLSTCAALGCPTVATGDFTIQSNSDGCSGVTLAAGAGCSTLVNFVPTAPGARTALLVFPVNGATENTRIVSGTGVANPTDCVLDWAERTYPGVLTSPTATFVAHPFYARCYQGGTLCVGADALATVAPPSVYLYQEGTLARYDYLSALVIAAGCN